MPRRATAAGRASGTIAVTNCDSPRGSAQRYSITASTRPSRVGSTSRSGRMSVSSRKRARSPGSLRRPGALTARKRVARDRTRVPHRLEQRGVVRVGEYDDLVRRLRCRGDRAHAGAQTPADAPVVALRPVKAQNEHGDRDRDHPGALGELRLDHEQCDDRRRECARSVHERALAPAALSVRRQ